MKEIVVKVAFKSKYPQKIYSVMLSEDSYARLKFELYRAEICDIDAKPKSVVDLEKYPTVKSFMRSINREIFECVVLFELEYERDRKLGEYTERLYADDRIPDSDIPKYRQAFFENKTVIYTEKLFIKDFAQRYSHVTEIISI